MASNSANAATTGSDQAEDAPEAAQPSTPASATAPTAAAHSTTPQEPSSLAVSSTTGANSNDVTAHHATASAMSTSEAAVGATDTSESQSTPSSAESAEPPDSSISASQVPATASTSTTSMLPRASAAMSASSPSSGTATPTARNAAPRAATSTAAPNRYSHSQAPPTGSALGSGRRPAARLSAQASNSRERAVRNQSAASALASPFPSHAMPSIFGYYSHDANPVGNLPSTASPSSSLGAPPWPQSLRESVYHQRAASHSPVPVRPNHSAASTPTFSPRAGSISFYPAHPQRQNGRVPSNLGNTYRSAETQRSTANHSVPAASGWESSLLASSLPSEQPIFEETTTISFTWSIRDLHLLREEVEHSPPPSEGGRSVSAGAGKSDVWTNQPVFGDNKWKLELVRTTRPLTDQSQENDLSNGYDGSDDGNDEVMPVNVHSADPNADQVNDSDSAAGRPSITILSVYLTALVLEYTHANVEIPASIMVGLRPIRAAIGRRGAESGGYLWRRFYDYTFQKEADLFTCHDLPSVSEMLQDPNVARDDAVALTIQLGLGPGHTRARSGQLDDAASAHAPIEVDGHHLVPRAVLSSLHGLLDDANTGDVRILVRERGVLLPETPDSASMSEDGHPDKSVTDSIERIVPYPIGSSCPTAPASASQSETPTFTPMDDDPDRIFVRDRVLWAHASVLKSRSDYFQTMLASDFSEGISRNYAAAGASAAHGRNVRTLQISDADFVTAYWFLRYLYTDDIQFADKEDVRSAILDEEWAKGSDVGHLTAGSASGDAGHAGALPRNLLVDWTPISQLKDNDDFEMDGMGYPMTTAPSAGGPRDVSGSFVLQKPSTTSGSLRQRTSAAGLVDGASGNVSARPLSAPNSPSSAIDASAASKHHTTDEGSRASGRGTSNAPATRASATLDPHTHPCADPGPASALSIFKLAHRYHMEELSRLAAMHMVATLTPQSAFPMLLATSMYAELHTRIKTYVYQQWHLVSHTEEFERCCDEVSVGMWGADAGKTMRAFVRSLVSPLRAGGQT
ncbi:BTB domain-containing protein [Pseudozyma hubeiensis]|nr:BTB domain-containing protein [Pseudozyma hubeiensis]